MSHYRRVALLSLLLGLPSQQEIEDLVICYDREQFGCLGCALLGQGMSVQVKGQQDLQACR